MRTSTPGKSASPRRTNSGLTLIELMVTMAIVGVIFALGATGLRSAFNVGLKSSAGKLAATLRYLSNKAVTDHLYLRVVYDIDDRSYHVEESADPFVVTPEDDEKGSSKKKETATAAPKDKENGAEGEESPPPKEEKEEAQKVEEKFTQSESKLLQPVKLPSDVFFKDVSVSYQQGKKTQGQAYTYFFPDGYATPTLINLRNEDDDEFYSIEVMALSGRVKVVGDYRESLAEEKKE